MEEITDDVMLNANEKQRHGCVTAWLILMIITNSISSLAYLFFGDLIKALMEQSNQSYKMEDWMYVVLGIVSTANVLFSIFLFQWKKIGFLGFIVTSIITVILNLQMGLGIGQSSIGLLGIAILYGILQIKNEGISAWSQLD